MFTLDQAYWEVKKTRSIGQGVFAVKSIEPGTVIGDYLGKVIHPSEDTSDKYGMYNLWINFDTLVYANPKEVGVHLLNHNCAPNCAMYPYQGHILFFALRKIFSGEQLTIQYLIDPPARAEVDLMHPCRCGHIMCRGTLHGTEKMSRRWGEFLEEEYKKYRQLENLDYGTGLPPLPDYNLTVPDNPIYDLFGASQKAPLRLANKTLPTLAEIRSLIRSTGRSLNLAKINLEILGMMNGILISTPHKKSA